MSIQIKDREALVQKSETFHDLISSYGGEPPEEDMQQARDLLTEIAAALETALNAKIEKAQ